MADCGTPEKPLCLADIDFSTRPNSYPGIVLTGEAFDRGVEYGRVFADKIRANVARHLNHPDLPFWSNCVPRIRDVYLPALERHWHIGFMELRGMALGSGVNLHQLVFLNAREDLAAIRHLLEPYRIGPKGRREEPQDPIATTSACFSHRVTADGAPVLAHTWSTSKQVHDENLIVCLEIQYPPWEELSNLFMVVEAGMISGCGMSADGLAVTGNGLFSSGDIIPAAGDGSFPMTCLERGVLEWGYMDSTRRMCERLERHASKHLLLVDGNGSSMSLELGVERIFAHYGVPGNHTKVHANHFQSFEAFASRRKATDRYPDRQHSAARLERVTNLIAERRGDGVSRQQIQDIFSDHGDSSANLCQHRHNNRVSMTAAFVMFDTKRKVISVCKGPPCQGVMMHFTFQKFAGGDDGAVDAEMKDVETANADAEMREFGDDVTSDTAMDVDVVDAKNVVADAEMKDVQKNNNNSDPRSRGGPLNGSHGVRRGTLAARARDAAAPYPPQAKRVTMTARRTTAMTDVIWKSFASRSRAPVEAMPPPPPPASPVGSLGDATDAFMDET
ncbi:hypothetical protein C8A00DRAFT_17563 [Chaetomidium leptoderma]|uniref:Peptidase C45 hydrolase domain-containing protein n=1 Tax=Chaetomidium leptoderma TaxID=669021 RepID=A0AAN6VHJ8_9PEZI|nr:hypothetical protein C8A00DRAFT_17563 [Chaetomidium leptoderma]